ncbi:MAG: DUF115 domain-containing protein, partial [Aliifodinibius sp.]|nr:DUF115 domain-containing protein [Fodinibius sp.]NIV13201.1 DUF115 domain-containing protein [Fodinibius sp.]NIY26866.1 DUF115 domain-containing protein [Fodinibius sp.]
GPVGELKGFGRNKAVIAIGAGPSLKNNIEYLKEVSLIDGTKPYENQDFIFIASNHQFKPCLKRGIIPHFVMLCDAADSLMDQMCKDIPANGQATILLASLQVSPKIIKRWREQGRKVKFLMSAADKFKELFEKETKDTVADLRVVQGGNIMNNMWTLSGGHLKSTVYMGVGNDMSFPRAENIKEQRKSFYEDEDYSTNIASKRDEARSQHDWMGFEFYENVISTSGAPLIRLKPVRTTGQFLTYKAWIESMVGLNVMNKQVFRYYNCSEAGILGVKCKDESVEGLENKENWFLLDEVYPKRWCTRKLEDAVTEFLAAKTVMRQRINANLIEKPKSMSTLQ